MPGVTALPAASGYEIVLALHIIAVVVAFGATFIYPVMFAVGARSDPRILPLLHRVEYTIERTLPNFGLLVVLGAGIFLASDDHLWSEFFVQWGLCAVVVIGFYAAVFTHRLGLDPDNHGIAIVTSSLDLFGAFSLILAIVLLGLH